MCSSDLQNNIKWIAGTSHAPWRQSMSESIVKLFKVCLKRSNLYNKTLTANQWRYALSKCQNILNQRPLSVNWINDSFTFLTPNMVVFGSNTTMFPPEINTESISDVRLFEKMLLLDKELEKFISIWEQEYFSGIRRWLKWKDNGQQLCQGDIVMVLDKLNKFTHQPILARVKDVLSDRSYRVEYVKSQAIIDKETFQIKKTAKIATLERPAQQLACILEASSQDKFVSLDVAEKNNSQTIVEENDPEENSLQSEENISEQNYDENILQPEPEEESNILESEENDGSLPTFDVQPRAKIKVSHPTAEGIIKNLKGRNKNIKKRKN